MTTAFHHHNFKTIPTGEKRVRQEEGMEECEESEVWKRTVQFVCVCCRGGNDNSAQCVQGRRGKRK